MIRFIFIIFGILINLSSLVLSFESCPKVTGRTGVVTVETRDYVKDQYGDIIKLALCRDIIVPQNQFVRLTIEELFMSSTDCSNNRLEIIQKLETFVLCGDDKITNSITAVSNIKIQLNGGHYRGYDKNKKYGIHWPSLKLKYKIFDIECLNGNTFNCSDYSCIPKNEVCDGVKDCDNGADEVGCETGILSIKGIAAGRSKEITWMNSQRSSSWGWHENTARVLPSLFLAGGVTLNGSNYEEELMAKQTEFKTSIALLKNPLSNEQLSMFINSLLVTCHNPRHFYGQNLIKQLKEQVQSSGNFTHPLAYLTLSNANETWPIRATKDLNNILKTDADYPFVRDYQAIAVMAISCYDNQTQFLNNVEHNSLKSNYEKAIKLFKESQLSDGSFGNIHTTSLITQALISSGQEYEKDWKLNATIHYLLQQLESPHDIVASVLTLPVLNAKSLSDISRVNCTSNPRKNGYDLTEMSDYVGPKMRVQYSLFVGDQKDVVHTISLRVPENYTAYEVMKVAETEDSKFTFKYKKISGMMYVYQIDDVTNDPEGGFFWLLYQGLQSINSTLTHYNLSPDQLVMQNNEHLVMWYKKAHF